MNKTPPRIVSVLAPMLLLAVSSGLTAQAQTQGYSKTFSRSAAMDPGISFQLCKNDMAILVVPGAVKSVGVTMPDSVEPIFDGNKVVLRGNTSTGRTPVLVLLKDSDDFYRLNIAGCPTRGTSTLIKIVDDSPAPAAAREYSAAPAVAYQAPLSPMKSTPAAAAAPVVTAPISTSTANTLNVAAAIGDGGTITLPTPTTVSLELARTATGLTLTVTNGTAQTLKLTPANLQVIAGGEVQSSPATIGGNLAPGMISAYTIPLPGNLQGADVQANWLVYAPGIKANFVVRADLK